MRTKNSPAQVKVVDRSMRSEAIDYIESQNQNRWLGASPARLQSHNQVFQCVQIVRSITSEPFMVFTGRVFMKEVSGKLDRCIVQKAS